MLMLLELADIGPETIHVEREYPASAFRTEGEDYRVTDLVRLEFDVTRTGDRYRLVGRLAGRLEVACSRCAEPCPWLVAVDFDLRYLPQAANIGEGDLEVAEEDLDVAFYEGEHIDLGQLVREQFYLSLPMKPLCSTDCRGLCPQCGTNLNVTLCACDTRWVDPRLALLAAMHVRDRRPS